MGAPHVPALPHVSTPLPEHWTAPGLQTPTQAPVTHAWLLHGTAVPQVPVTLHVWTASPEHCVVPGTQMPVHVPMEHA
jgi:hypothetical protein